MKHNEFNCYNKIKNWDFSQINSPNTKNYKYDKMILGKYKY